MSNSENSDTHQWPSLHALRESQKKDQVASAHDAFDVEARRQWLLNLRDQRLDLFDALCELIEADREACLDTVIAAQKDIEVLRDLCKADINDTRWTVENPDELPNLIKKHTWACQRQIALLDLEIKLLEKQLDDAARHQTAPESTRKILLLPIRDEQTAPSLLEIMARGYQHLGAIRILQRRENFLRGKQRGNPARNRKPKKMEMQHLITIMVKLLHQTDPLRSSRAFNDEVSARYVDKILDIWASWPFLPLDTEMLKEQVEKTVESFDMPQEKKKILYKRREHTTMARPKRNDITPLLTVQETYKRICQAHQNGVVEALIQVMEGKFGELNNEQKASIQNSSTEQLGVWLRCVHDADSVKDLLSLPALGKR